MFAAVRLADIAPMNRFLFDRIGCQPHLPGAMLSSAELRTAQTRDTARPEIQIMSYLALGIGL